MKAIPTIPLEPDLERIVKEIEDIGEEPLINTLKIVDATPTTRVQKVSEFLEITHAQASALCRYYEQDITLPIQKPRGYWTYKINIFTEFVQLMKKIGRVPTQQDMNKNAGGRTLPWAISQVYDSYLSFLELYGFKYEGPALVSKWRDWDYFSGEIRKIIDDNPSLDGKFPSLRWLHKNGYKQIVPPICNIHGGIAKICKKLRIEPIYVKPEPDLTVDGIRKQLLYIWKKYPSVKNTVPPDDWLRGHGFSTLGGHIVKFGGFRKLRNELRIEQPQKHTIDEYNTWQKFKRALMQIQKDYPELKNVLPSQRWLVKHKYHTLLGAIPLYGGMEAIRTRLGNQTFFCDPKEFSDPKYIRTQFETIFEKHPELKRTPPSLSWLYRHEYNKLANGIKRYFPGGIHGVYNSFSHTPSQKPKKYWSVLANVEKELAEVIQTLQYVPSLRQMRSIHASLGAAIGRHGGLAHLISQLAEKGFPIKDPLEVILESYVKNQ